MVHGGRGTGPEVGERMIDAELVGVWRSNGTQRPDCLEWDMGADGTYAIRSYPRAEYNGEFKVFRRAGQTFSVEVTGLQPGVWKGDAVLDGDTLQLGGAW